MIRNVTARGVTALAVGGSLFFGFGPGVHAEEDFGGFQAFTDASGVRGTYSVSGFAIAEPIDLGAPVAQATLDTLAGRAFGSLPYPGDTAVRYPGYVALATGSAPPGYPLFVEAQHPQTPEGAFTDPSGQVALAAKAAADSSTGTAAIGGGDDASPASSASTAVKRDTGKLVATAESVDRGIDVGGAVQIGTVISRSVTTYTPGGQPTTETLLRIEGGRAGDMSFGYGPNGLTVASAGVPLPARDGLAALNKALEPAGLVLSFADAVPITGGAQSAGLVLEKQADIPGGGPGRFRLRFGQASSAIVVEGTAPPAASAGEVSPLPVAEPPAPSDAGAPAAGDTSLPVDAVTVPEPIAAPVLPLMSGYGDFARTATVSTAETDVSAEDGVAAFAPEAAAPAPEATQPGPPAAVLAPAALAASSSGLFDDNGDRAVFGAITAVALFGVGAAMLWRRGMSQWTS
jgi:hypothetical protein